MRKTWQGDTPYVISCYNFDELMQAVKKGDWFRTDNMDWYYRRKPVMAGDNLPENVALLEKVCVTSVNTKWSYFYKFKKVDDPSKVIYTGKSLEDKICADLEIWAMHLNPKTMRAFTGRSLENYLNAIPKEMYLDCDFERKMEQSLKKGFILRLKTTKFKTEAEMDEVERLSLKALQQVRKGFDKKMKNQEDFEVKLSAELDKHRERKMKNIVNIFDR